MFGIGKPRPPLGTAQRVEIDLLMRQTVGEVGAEAIRDAEIVGEIGQLDLDASSPEALVASASAAVRRHLQIDVELPHQIVDAQQLGRPSQYQAGSEPGFGPAISVADETALDPLRTVVELANQHAHHYWLSRRSEDESAPPERLTHLLPVCFGLGILASDASLCDNNWTHGGWSGWSIARAGFYNAAELGYAMALVARARGESKPAWRKWMRLDSRDAFDRANRFFSSHEANSGALLFDAAKIPTRSSDQAELARWLVGNDSAFAFAAARSLCRFDELNSLTIDSVLKATAGRDADLLPVAVGLLAGCRSDQPRVTERVLSLIRSSNIAVSFSAIRAANVLGLDLRPYAAACLRVLEEYPDSLEMLRVLEDQGHGLRDLESSLCKQIRQVARFSDKEILEAQVRALARISDDPAAALKRNLQGTEFQEEAIGWLDKIN